MSISFNNLSLGYGSHTVLENINLELPSGCITALLGPNGCGKSTLLKSITKILTPTKGEVKYLNKNVKDIDSKYFSTQISLLPQVQPIPEGITVETLISYGRSPYTGFWGKVTKSDKQFMYQVMEEVGVLELKNSFLNELSGGQRQRAWLAMVLAQDTPYILLDEPTTYMDINHQVELMAILRRLNRKGKTIIVVLHDINQAARYCDHLVLLKKGKLIAQGSPSEMITQTMMKEVFEIDTQIHQDPITDSPMCIIKDSIR
jgi:iron complex transport system ATP-binding protein